MGVTAVGGSFLRKQTWGGGPWRLWNCCVGSRCRTLPVCPSAVTGSRQEGFIKVVDLVGGRASVGMDLLVGSFEPSPVAACPCMFPACSCHGASSCSAGLRCPGLLVHTSPPVGRASVRCGKRTCQCVTGRDLDDSPCCFEPHMLEPAGLLVSYSRLVLTSAVTPQVCHNQGLGTVL